jgi:hypothetical protein
MKFCSHCGASVEQAAAFCSGCGGSVSPGHAGPSTPAHPAPGGGRRLVIAGLGLFVLVGALWTTMGSSSTDPERSRPVAAAAELESSIAAVASESEDVVLEEPGFVGRLIGEKPRVFVTVSEGESLALELRETISTKSASTGDVFSAGLTKPVKVEGLDALPLGTLVTGHVAHAEPSDKVKGLAELTLEFDSLELPSGEKLSLVAEPVHFEARSTKKKDAAKIGGGAGIGALVGGIIGGKKGAAIGAGVGAGAGTGAVLATSGEEVVLSEGAQVSTMLGADLRVELINNEEP